jgi:hypothetical protein
MESSLIYCVRVVADDVLTCSFVAQLFWGIKMTDAPADWIKAAVAITPGFEVSGDPYLGVSGDFDGMGISCGALQWNIGQGSLQPLVKRTGKTVVLSAMPTYGAEMWTACNTSVSKGLKIVRGWQTGSTLKAKAKAELKALMGTAAMRAEQDAEIKIVGQVAFDRAEQWAKDGGGTDPSKRLFCWFFDVVTQNGGLEGLTPQKVAEFIKVNKPDKVDDLICDFLKDKNGTSGHVNDAHKNAGLWRNNATGDKLDILCMTYLRSKTANPIWQHVVINRKGTIAMGKGWVNSGKFDFSGYGL